MRRRLHRNAALLIFVLTLSGCNALPFFSHKSATPAQPSSAASAPAPAPAPVAVNETGRVEMLWDTYGVPHIYGKDVYSAAYAFGWAQMRAHRNLLLRLYAQARGRSAEIWGEPFVASDTWVLTNDIPDRAATWLQQQRPEERAILDAFVAGINAFATSHPDSIDAPYNTVLPVVASDVLAHMQRVLNYTFVTAPVMPVIKTWQAGGASLPIAKPGGNSGGADSRDGGAIDSPDGSNAWAVGPRHTSSHRAMLLANPHLPWGDVFTWFEAEFSTPEANAYGAGLVGFPLLSIAFNDSIGWTHTVNTMDGADLYDIKLNGPGYMYDGAQRAFETKQKVLKVKQADGTVASRTLTIRSTVQGPVVAERNGGALALRVTGLDAPHVIQQTWEMMTSHNIGDFEHALSRMQLPMFTVMYADHTGNIMHLFDGRVPERSHGDYAFWHGVVPGDSSSLVWNSIVPYDRLPRLVNPATGWLQNANDPPWTTTVPVILDYARFPAWLAPSPTMSFRAIRSARMLAEDSSITLDDLIAYKHSTRSEEADHILEDVIEAARKSSSISAHEAAAVLEHWDRSTNADSRGALLFLELARVMNSRSDDGFRVFDVPWTMKAPLSTPDGIADPAAVVRMLDAAAERVRARYGSLDAPWGASHRLVRDSVDLPGNGGPPDIGIFRAVTYDSVSPTRSVASEGDSWVAAIEFSQPVRARVLLTYGNWSLAGSPHRVDQLPLFARKELRSAWRTRGEVEQHLEFKEVF